MSELAKRILFGIPAAAAALFITWLGEGYFHAALVILALMIQHEVQGLADKVGFKADPFLSYTIAFWIILVPVLPYATEIGIAIFLILMGRQVLKKRMSIDKNFSPLFFVHLMPLLGSCF